MKVKKADDYQSWFIEEGKEALLIDPWFDLSKAFITLAIFFFSIALSKEDPIKPQPRTQILSNINNFL